MTCLALNAMDALSAHATNSSTCTCEKGQNFTRVRQIIECPGGMTFFSSYLPGDVVVWRSRIVDDDIVTEDIEAKSWRGTVVMKQHSREQIPRRIYESIHQLSDPSMNDLLDVATPHGNDADR